jgi:hypothetical protein
MIAPVFNGSYQGHGRLLDNCTATSQLFLPNFTQFVSQGRNLPEHMAQSVQGMTGVFAIPKAQSLFQKRVGRLCHVRADCCVIADGINRVISDERAGICSDYLG